MTAKAILPLPSQEIKLANGTRVKVAWIRGTTGLSYNTLASCPVLPVHLKRTSLHSWRNFTSLIGHNGKLLRWAFSLWFSKGLPTKQTFPSKAATRFCDNQQTPLCTHHCSSYSQHDCCSQEVHGSGTETMIQTERIPHQQATVYEI